MTASLLQARLGYVFKNAALLEAALTHSSHGAENYERLEFLGDRVLGVVIGSWIFERFPDANEGELSRRHMALVRESCLARVAESWNLADYMRLGAGEGSKESIMADMVEAVLGAVWVDAGLAKVDALVRREWAQVIDAKDEKDPKTRLQEWLQGQGFGLPRYEVVEESGPDHDKYYKVRAISDKGGAIGEGRSKQLASADAANALMSVLENLKD